MAFVHLLCYLNRPHPSTTHCSGDLFINIAIMQLATYEIYITIEQMSLPCVCRHFAASIIYTHIAPRQNGKMAAHTRQAWRIKNASSD